jgi:hypothetical protein
LIEPAVKAPELLQEGYNAKTAGEQGFLRKLLNARWMKIQRECDPSERSSA